MGRHTRKHVTHEKGRANNHATAGGNRNNTFSADPSVARPVDDTTVNPISESMPPHKTQSFWFLHGDLGRGGAERWLLDTADALTRCDHSVSVFLSRPVKPSECFEDLLRPQAYSVNTPLIICPRSLFGRFVHLFAISAMIYLVFYLRVALSMQQFEKPDIIVIDTVPFVALVLSWLFPNSRIVFYCHFPDSLIQHSYEDIIGTNGYGDAALVEGCNVLQRKSFFLSFYKSRIWHLEASAFEDPRVEIVTNSFFTRTVVHRNFNIPCCKKLKVLHPTCRVNRVIRSFHRNQSNLDLSQHTDDDASSAPYIPKEERVVPINLQPVDESTSPQKTSSSSVFGEGDGKADIPANVKVLEPWIENALADGSSFLLSMNRLHPSKRHEMAIDAFSLYLATYATSSKGRDKTKLIIAGNAQDPTYIQYLHDCIPPHLIDRIIIAQNITDFAKTCLLQACDAVIYTPVFEHFGIGIVEALSHGKPAIVSAYGGAKEIFEGPPGKPWPGWEVLKDLLVTDPYDLASYAAKIDLAINLGETERFLSAAEDSSTVLSFGMYLWRSCFVLAQCSPPDRIIQQYSAESMALYQNSAVTTASALHANTTASRQDASHDSSPDQAHVKSTGQAQGTTTATPMTTNRRQRQTEGGLRTRQTRHRKGRS